MFHTNAPSPLAPRHRNRHVSSQLAVDSSGREHLLLHFWVEAKHPSLLSPTHTESQPLLDFTFSSVYDQAASYTTSLLSDFKRAFAYLVGSPVPTQNGISAPPSTSDPPSDTANKSTTSSWAGMFSRLRSSPAPAPNDLGSHTEWTGGEVHVDLVKVCHTTFTFPSILLNFCCCRTTRENSSTDTFLSISHVSFLSWFKLHPFLLIFVPRQTHGLRNLCESTWKRDPVSEKAKEYSCGDELKRHVLFTC